MRGSNYMRRHIDVQVDWRSCLTYGRAPNARDFFGFFNVPVQAPTHGQPFYVYYIPRNRHFSRLLHIEQVLLSLFLKANIHITTLLSKSADKIKPVLYVYILVQKAYWTRHKYMFRQGFTAGLTPFIYTAMKFCLPCGWASLSRPAGHPHHYQLGFLHMLSLPRNG